MGGAALLGKDGLAELIERNCRHARRFAEGLPAAGYGCSIRSCSTRCWYRLAMRKQPSG